MLGLANLYWTLDLWLKCESLMKKSESVIFNVPHGRMWNQEIKSLHSQIFKDDGLSNILSYYQWSKI